MKICEDIQEYKLNKLLKDRQRRQDPVKFIFKFYNISNIFDAEKTFIRERFKVFHSTKET